MMVNRVTLLGNKDHGKSTLIGSLLIQTGSVSEQRINDAKKTSQKLGRKFEPGYILDSFEEERLNEMTIDTTRAQVKYKNTGFEFIDVPGHEELMKNMLSGASYADFALLIVSAKPDEGITDQTKRHLFVAKLMGINKIVVAVNKLDTVNYSKERFEQIVVDIKRYLEKIGFKSEEIRFIPVSAYNSENLVAKSQKITWYKDESLIEILMELAKSKEESTNNDLVVLLQGLQEGSPNSVFGKVLSGKLNKGDKVIILPQNKTVGVKELFVNDKRKKSASRGNMITLVMDEPLANVKGSIACLDKSACKVSDTINALFFDTKPVKGRVSIRINGVEVACNKINVNKSIDIATGDTKNGGSIKPLQAAYIELTLEKKIPIENFEKIPEIGRFVLYSDRSFAGIGVIRD